MMQINMSTIVVLTKLFIPDLLATNGKIINTASTAAFQPGPYMAVYYATKAFVLSFSEAIAAELEGTGVTVTALCPGPTASGFQDKADMHASALVKNKNLPIAEEVAALGYRAMQRGQRVYIPGVTNWLMVQSLRFTPRSLVTNTSDSFGTGMLREQSQKIPGILTENKKKALFTLSSKNTRTQKNA